VMREKDSAIRIVDNLEITPLMDTCAFIGTNPSRRADKLPRCPSSAQTPKPAGPGRERHGCLRHVRTIKAA
jgi:hypothetical protein